MSEAPGPKCAGRPQRVRLWDPFLRGFHWLLAALVIGNLFLGHFGPSVMTLHFWFGYGVIGLIVLRLIWGFVGPPEARFMHFLRGPREVSRYARHMFRREPSYWPGHNPLGALSVVALLTLLVVQVATGLISDPDDYINVGPLADQVTVATSRKAVGWHHLGSTLILLLVILHVAIILFYRFWKHEDLIGPMIIGWKTIIRRN